MYLKSVPMHGGRSGLFMRTPVTTIELVRTDKPATTCLLPTAM